MKWGRKGESKENARWERERRLNNGVGLLPSCCAMLLCMWNWGKWTNVRLKGRRERDNGE
jgi:hypothetical protein